MTDKGDILNKRVWSLFEKAGFETRPSSKDKREEAIALPGGVTRTPDLSAVAAELKVKILGENTIGKSKESFSTYVNDMRELMTIAKANAGLFVLTGMTLTEADKLLAEEKGIKVWGEQELQYFEAVADAIGGYAKYEIISALGVETEEEKSIHNVLAIRLQQPHADSAVSLFMFTLTPEKLLRTCVVLRKVRGNRDAYQRMIRKTRLNSIRAFVSTEGALLPPNVILYLGDKVRWDRISTPRLDASERPITITRSPDYELVLLQIPMAYASLELIDGQHRVFGFADAAPSIQKGFNLVILGMMGLSPEARRDTFVAINDKARRVDANLVAYLKLVEDEATCQGNPELMAIKVVVELNKTTPFKDKIRLWDVGDQKITLKGFSGYDLRGLLGPKGLLRKYYPRNKCKFYVSALRMYFSIISSTFPIECKDPQKYVIFTNRGISAFLKLLKSILKNSKSKLTEKRLKRYMKLLRDNWKQGWETEKLSNSYIGSKGWKDFHRDLVAAIQKGDARFEE